MVFDALDIVQYSNDEFWMIGDETGRPSNYEHIKIIAKVTPPDPADDKTIAQFLRNAD